MIIKGKSRSGPHQLAVHLGNAEKNEKVNLIETRGTVADDLRGALLEMDAIALGTKCEKPLYHAAISPEPPNLLTADQRTEAIEALEQHLGLNGHARIVVMHEKLGRQHFHVVWSRIDINQMKSVSDGHNYRIHERVSRDLERRFGHNHVQGAHHERDGIPRPNRTPSRAELRQEERTGITGKQVKAEVTEAFKASDNAEAFNNALHDRGMLIAKGDRRDFVVVDRQGGIHSLARRIDGIKATELRKFMSPLAHDPLPTVDEARQIIMDRMRQKREMLDSGAEARKDKSYGRGEDYVSQATAAQHDFERRQKVLNQTAKLNRLLRQYEQSGKDNDLAPNSGPDDRPPAPGGGRTRSR